MPRDEGRRDVNVRNLSRLAILVIVFAAVSASVGVGGPVSADRGGTAECVKGRDWPIIGGNAANLNAACAEGPGDGALRYTVAFEGAGGPVLAVGGILFVPTGAVWGGPNRVTALGAATGEFLWAKDFSTPPILTASGKGLLFVGTFGGTLYALRTHTGREAWTFSTTNWIVPIYADGIVFAASFDGYLHALEATTGTEIWRFAPGTAHWPAIGMGLVFLAVDHVLYALDASNGTERWSVALDSFIGGQPTLYRGSVYVGTGGLGASGFAYALDALTGEIVWSRPIGYDVYVEAVTQGIVLLTGPWPLTTRLQALDANTGDTIWEFGPFQFPQYGVTVSGSQVVAVTFEGVIHALDLRTGAGRWSAPLTGPIHNQVRPSPVRGTIAVATGTTLHVFGPVR